MLIIIYIQLNNNIHNIPFLSLQIKYNNDRLENIYYIRIMDYNTYAHLDLHKYKSYNFKIQVTYHITLNFSLLL